MSGSSDNKPTLTEEHVIIIACVCGVIIITLLVILFCFIFRRRRNAAKHYQSGNQGDPPPYSTVASHKKPQVYDNQDNRMDGFPSRDAAGAGGVPHSPTKDKYITLQDRAGPGGDVVGPDAGYNNAGSPGEGGGAGGKPKKKIKWRWHWRRKETPPPAVPQFSHNPPGHTCGLPCCNHDNDMTPRPADVQRGCVVVPVFAPLELSESNFVMKRKPRPSSMLEPITGAQRAAVTSERGYKSEGEELEEMLSDEENGGGEVVDQSGNRRLRFTKNTAVMTSVAAPELLTPRGPHSALYGVSSSLLRNRKHLSSWEQIKQRHITLPDEPKVPHRIVFLNHTPGESSDFHEMGSLDYRSLKNRDEKQDKSRLNSVDTDILSLDPDTFDRKSLENSRVDSATLESRVSKISSPVSEPVDGGDDVTNGSSRDLTMTRRSVHSQLPPLPTEQPSPGLGARRKTIKNKNTVVDEIEEDTESLMMEESSSLYQDHVYDVVNDVKAESEKLAAAAAAAVAVEGKEKEEEGKEKKEEEEEKSNKNNNNNNNLPLHHHPHTGSTSDLTMSDCESLTYQASISDSNTESYIYNGSLLSQATDYSESPLFFPGAILGTRYQADHDTNQPASILRQRYKRDNSRRPMIFMLGGRPLVLPEKCEQGKDSPSADQSDSLNNISLTTRSDQDTDRSSSEADLHKLQLKVEDYDQGRGGRGGGEDVCRAQGVGQKGYHDAFIHRHNCSYLDLAVGSVNGLDLSDSTKLKLWDLRLININREENQYSTFPLRKPTLDDLGVGCFPRGPETGHSHRHRHNSDVSTDHYVTRKIYRLLRSPVLSHPPPVATCYNLAGAPCSDHSSDILDTSASYNPYRGHGQLEFSDDCLETWKHFFLEKRENPKSIGLDLGVGGDYSKLPPLKTSLGWPGVEEEEPIYEPITLSGIFNWERRDNSQNHLDVYGKGGYLLHPERQHVDSLLVRKKDGGRRDATGSDTDSYVTGSGLCGGTGSLRSASLYSGSLYGSSGGSIGGGGGGGRNKSASLLSLNNKTVGPPDKTCSEVDDRPVIWGDASVVDWRRQAELFRDKNLITLIL